MSALHKATHRLLFRQFMALALCSGVVALRYPLPAFLLLIFILLCSKPHNNYLFHVILLFLCAALGLGYASYRTPVVDTPPAWATLYSDPASEYYRKSIRIRASVHSVTALTDRRLQIILQDVRPVDPAGWVEAGTLKKSKPKVATPKTAQPQPSNTEVSKLKIPAQNLVATQIPGSGEQAAVMRPVFNDMHKPLPGYLVLTWEQALTPEGIRPQPEQFNYRRFTKSAVPAVPLFQTARPLPGDEFEATIRLRQIKSLQNFKLWEVEQYWADRSVYFRAWVNGADGDIHIIVKNSSFMLSWREALRQRVLQLLPHDDAVTTGAQAQAVASQNGAKFGGLGLAKAAAAAASDTPKNLPAKNSTVQTSITQATTAQLQDGGNSEVLAQSVLAKRKLSDGAQLIPALLFADKYLLDTPDTDLFARSTLAHSLALSGLHLGYAAAIGYALGYIIFWFFPTVSNWLPRKKLCLFCAFFPALFYLWLGGAPPSLLRAFLMLAVWGVLMLKNRQQVLLDGLIWAVLLIALYSPLTLFDLRLQLSALAVASIAFYMPFLSKLAKALQQRIYPKQLQYAYRQLKIAQHSPPQALTLCNVATGKLPEGALTRARLFYYSRKYSARIVSGFVYTLGLSLVTQLALLPLIAKSFGFTGWALYLNLLWLPVLGFWVMPAAFTALIGTALGLECFAAALFKLAVYPCNALLELLRGMELLLQPQLLPRPHWLFMFAYWLLFFSLPYLIKYVKAVAIARKQRNACPKAACYKLVFILLSALTLAFIPLLQGRFYMGADAVHIRMLDVGQGQAILVEWQGGRRLLLDGGGGGSPRFDLGREVITASLAQNRWPSLDYMLASHPDTDHVQGLIYPASYLPVSQFADNGDVGEGAHYKALHKILQKRGLEPQHLFAGDAFALSASLKLEVLHPPRPDAAAAKLLRGNDAALVCRLVWKGEPLALFCGDIEQRGIKSMLERYLGEPQKLMAKILILPHHGAKSSLSPELYMAVKPQYAVASCGFGNPWNFPSKAVRESLQGLGVPLLSTSECGQIHFTVNKEQVLSFETARSFLLGEVLVP